MTSLAGIVGGRGGRQHPETGSLGAALAGSGLVQHRIASGATMFAPLFILVHMYFATFLRVVRL